MFSKISVLNYSHNNNLCHCIIKAKNLSNKDLVTMCRGTYNFKKNLFVIKHLNVAGRDSVGFRAIMKALEKHDWDNNVIGIEKSKKIVSILLKEYRDNGRN